jgi:hypothetical protein
MTGAREYAQLFESGKYGNFRIESGKHARGYEFHVFICTPEGEAEVYGILGGQPGWTEYYGWLYHGPWEYDFKKLVKKQTQIKEENDKNNHLKCEIRQRICNEKVIKILNSYKTE